MVSGFDVPFNQSIVRICYNGYNQQVEPQLALFHGYNSFSPCHKLGCYGSKSMVLSNGTMIQRAIQKMAFINGSNHHSISVKWRFPEMGVAPNHPYLARFSIIYKPFSYWGTPMTSWKPP